jgi:hypothetical protein
VSSEQRSRGGLQRKWDSVGDKLEVVAAQGSSESISTIVRVQKVLSINLTLVMVCGLSSKDNFSLLWHATIFH